MYSAKKKATVVLCVVLICLVLLASSLIVAEHAHVCVGEKCNVCSVIDAVQKLVASLMAITVSSILLTLIHFNFSAILDFKNYFFTLISLKVKLSN